MKNRCVVYGLKVALLFSAVLMVLGCTAGNPPHGHQGLRRPVALTGARLSALIPAPAGFTFNPSASFNSGTQQAVPTPGASDASAFDCASWWSGKAYFGPGTIGYAVKDFTGPSAVTVRFDLNLYPAGTGAKVFDTSVAVQRRCRRFIYLDKDGLRYIVNAAIGPSARIGDRSIDVNAVETAANGTNFTTQTTLIEVGDALMTVNETGSARAPVSRSALPLAAIVNALRSAGF